MPVALSRSGDPCETPSDMATYATRVRPAEHIALPHGRYGRSRGKADLIAGHGAHEEVFSACHHVTAREETSPGVVR